MVLLHWFLRKPLVCFGSCKIHEVVSEVPGGGNMKFKSKQTVFALFITAVYVLV